MGIPDQGHSPSLASWLTHEFDARLSPLGSDILAAKPRGVGCDSSQSRRYRVVLRSPLNPGTGALQGWAALGCSGEALLQHSPF